MGTIQLEALNSMMLSSVCVLWKSNKMWMCVCVCVCVQSASVEMMWSVYSTTCSPLQYMVQVCLRFTSHHSFKQCRPYGGQFGHSPHCRFPFLNVHSHQTCLHCVLISSNQVIIQYNSYTKWQFAQPKHTNQYHRLYCIQPSNDHHRQRIQFQNQEKSITHHINCLCNTCSLL